jgi:hypothetical protein
MLLYPSIQEKVFEEIRSVCGTDRLPSIVEDHESLSYFTAALVESFRWAPVAPFGEDDLLILSREP